MNLHSGARSCPASRALLIERIERGATVTAVGDETKTRRPGGALRRAVCASPGHGRGIATWPAAFTGRPSGSR